MAKVTFKLTKTTQVQGEGRKEDLYTYTAGDYIACFRFHSKRAFVAVIHESSNVSKAVVYKLVEAFNENGVKQHDYKGGFKEAISELEVSHPQLKAVAPAPKKAPAPKAAPAPKGQTAVKINKTNFKANTRALIESISGGNFARFTTSNKDWLTYEGVKSVQAVYKIVLQNLKALGFAAGTSIQTTMNDDMQIAEFEILYSVKGTTFTIRCFPDTIPDQENHDKYHNVTVIDTVIK